MTGDKALTEQLAEIIREWVDKTRVEPIYDEYEHGYARAYEEAIADLSPFLAAVPDTRPALDEATGALVPVIQAVLDAHRPSEHGFCVTCGVQFYPTHQAERIAAALTERNNRA